MAYRGSHEPYGGEDNGDEEMYGSHTCGVPSTMPFQEPYKITVPGHTDSPQQSLECAPTAIMPLTSIPLHGVLSFLEQDDLMRSRAVCKQWHSAVMQEGQFPHVGRAFRVMAWRSGQQLTAKNNFRTDFMRVSAFLAIATASLFALPFLGYYDGAYQEQQLGTKLFTGLAAGVTMAAVTAMILLTLYRRSKRSCNTIIIAATTIVICIALSATAFHFSSSHYELQALNEAEPWTAECPPPPGKSYPASVRFGRPSWWEVETEVHEDNGVRYRWATFTGTHQQLLQIASQSCKGLPPTSATLDQQLLRYPVSAELGSLNPPERLDSPETRHMTYHPVHHSDGVIDPVKYRAMHRRWTESKVYREARLPLLASPSRFQLSAVRFQHKCVLAAFIFAIIVLWVTYFFVGTGTMRALRRHEHSSRRALSNFNPELTSVSRLEKMEKNSRVQRQQKKKWAIVRFYQWLLGDSWSEGGDGTLPNIDYLRRHANRPPPLGTETAPSTNLDDNDRGGDSDAHLPGWTPRDSPLTSSFASTDAESSVAVTIASSGSEGAAFAATDPASDQAATPIASFASSPLPSRQHSALLPRQASASRTMDILAAPMGHFLDGQPYSNTMRASFTASAETHSHGFTDSLPLTPSVHQEDGAVSVAVD